MYVTIVDKNYVLVEGWQFAGGLLGLFPKVLEVKDLGNNKWLAQVEIINQKDNSVVSSGFALCSKTEEKKKTFDEYAILSMAQTRAIGKAYRNLLGWVMKLAGYEATPAEEMKKGKIRSVQTKPAQPKKVVKKTGGNKKLAELKGMLKGKTDGEKISDLKKKTGIVLQGFRITERHAGVLVASLLNQDVKRT